MGENSRMLQNLTLDRGRTPRKSAILKNFLKKLKFTLDLRFVFILRWLYRQTEGRIKTPEIRQKPEIWEKLTIRKK